MEEIKVGQVWEHFKGGTYKIIAIAKESEGLKDCVIYEALYDDPLSKTWVRAKENFLEIINREGKETHRFKLIKNPD